MSASQNTQPATAATLAAKNDTLHWFLSRDDNDPAKTWWFHPTIGADRWNMSYPYQLMIVQAQDGGTYRSYQNMVFTLPIAPEALMISIPFAITTTVTLGGIVEEHNATPIRTITASGTTGVLPLRGVADQVQLNSLGIIATSIFAGTVTSANRIGSAATSFANDLGINVNNFHPNLVDSRTFNSSDPGEIGLTSGYYQFKLLEQFLENYAEIKKKGTPNLRLAFASWKDQHVYLVTPMLLNVERRASQPLEYLYNFQLKAWRRIKLNGAAPPSPNSGFRPVSTDPNALARLNNALSDARQILASVRDTMTSIVQDADRVLYEPLRQVALLVKDNLGVVLTMNDLPANIVLAAQPAIAQWASMNNTFSSFGNTLADADKNNQASYQALAALTNSSDKGNTGNGDILGPNAVLLQGAAPINKVFQNPIANYPFFNSIRVGDLKLHPNIVKLIGQEKDRVRSLTRLNFEQVRDTIDSTAASYADAVGAGNATYDSTYGRAASSTTRTPTTRDFAVLFSLNQVSLELSRLAASGLNTPNRSMSSVEFVAGLARQSGIAFTVPRSKYSVPFPYGHTLEKLSLLYLGDPDRWEEIAALNGLRTPYVDEEGFDLPLLVNGIGNTIVVADSSNLYIGQQVWISSSSTARTVRRITKIERLSTTQSIITVDGANDLVRFITLANATLHAFLPDTVNSQMLVYIPSDVEPATADLQTKAIPGLDQFDQLFATGGVDVLLTPDNDLAVTPDGDCRLAVGLTNIVQIVRLRLSCPRGALMGHAEYGFPLEPGTSVADLDAQSMAQVLNDLFADDPMFTGVYGVSISVNGPVVPITMAVGVTGVSDKIPITVNLAR